MANTTLTNAKRAKNDEFYTQLTDIEEELWHYKDYFRDQVVYCNCDDPYESNFFKYFALNFNAFGLKKLLTTSFVPSPIVGGQLPLLKMAGLKEEKKKEPFKIEITEVKDLDGNGGIDLNDVKLLLQSDKNTATPLANDGDFRGEECTELLKQADIVVTNPPFSLFREYVAQLIEYDKKFVIIGNKNAITYKEMFGLIKGNKVWVGYTPMGTDMLFNIPKDMAEELVKSKKEGSSYKIVNGEVKGRSQAIWFTNLEHGRRHLPFELYKTYIPEQFPRYDNYDAIEVSKVADIPADYDGVMGVPISFLSKYCPEQFEIVGSFNAGIHGEEIGAKKTEIITKDKTMMWNGPVVNKKPVYKRILIKHKKT